MLLAQMANGAPILLVLSLLVFLVFVSMLIIFAAAFQPWLQAFMSGTPVPMVQILGMRLRRTDVRAVVKALIMAQQAGVTLSCRQVEVAYLQGVDMERLIDLYLARGGTSHEDLPEMLAAGP